MLDRAEQAPGSGSRVTGPARLILVGAVAVLAWLVVPAASDSAGAQDGSSISLIAIDVDTTGNTATSFPSTIDACAEIGPTDSRVIDVVIGPNGIPSNLPLKSFQFNLLYDRSVVNVSAVDPAQLLNANPGSSVFSPSDPVPGTDGSHIIAALDASPAAGETGPGVITRVTLQAVGEGTSTLELQLGLQGAALFTSVPEAIPIDNFQFAVIAVGTSCPTAIPSPRPIPTQPIPDGPGDGEDSAPGTTPGPDAESDSTPPAEPTDAGSDGAASTPTGEDGPAGGAQTPDDDSEAVGKALASETGDGDGFPLWVIAPIVAGVLAAGATAFLVARYRRSRAA